MGVLMGVRFEKYHGLGNDFLVLLDLEDRHPVDPSRAAALCERRTGVGADGLIRATAAPAGAVGDVCMELFNADGSRAEMSGNGIRCLAFALVDAGLYPGRGEDRVRVLTDGGLRTVVVHRPDGTASVEMGAVKVLDTSPAEAIEVERVRGVRRLAAVEVGNPHLVVLLDGQPSLLALAEGPTPIRPERNVELMVLGPAPDEITMRVWERGVGETLACGTGACAVAAAASHWGLAGRRVVVHQGGGAATVELAGDDTAVLTGPAVHVATVEVPGTDVSDGGR
ncbi:MAG: diaminopimelate epimerase [Acidimicrobiales bacterium]